MCGLAAFFEPGRKFPEALLTGVDADLFHRGPDSGGRATEPGWALVFRRLAIMDPGAGSDQPMSDGEGRCTLAFNGEIYSVWMRPVVAAGCRDNSTRDGRKPAKVFPAPVGATNSVDRPARA